ncbi:hypothetical protein SNEBB_008051 [Seison nebaliae]|nr:hypothetical protein SNEBB_008051 [Seison nebaliae]
MPLSNLDKPIGRQGKFDVNGSTFALFFSEVVQHIHRNSRSSSIMHDKLVRIGYSIGLRFVDLMYLRDKRERLKSITDVLHFIQTTLWKALFGKEINYVERSTSEKLIYLLKEDEPVLNKYVSIPPELSHMNCASLNCGIIEAALISHNFPATVTCDTNNGTIYIIRLDEIVLQRNQIS